HRPEPPTSSRQAGQSVGSATSSARPNSAKNGAAARLKRGAFTLFVNGCCIGLEAIADIGSPQQHPSWLIAKAREPPCPDGILLKPSPPHWLRFSLSD